MNRPVYALHIALSICLLHVVPTTLAAQTPFGSADEFLKPQTNLLANAGFEKWNLGYAPLGPIPPDLWYPLGQTDNLFSQGNIQHRRVDVACPDAPRGASGKYFLEVHALDPNHYVSQKLANYLEYAGKTVTFSVDLSTPFPVGGPKIAIFDGVSLSTRTETVYATEFERVTVTHLVNSCPTTLEFRVYPQPSVWIDNAQVVLGSVPQALYVPAKNPEPVFPDVPLGTVLDWWRFHPDMPVPAGFAVCDGQTVVDPDSPFNGIATPDLGDRFVRGVTSPNLVGTTGGSSAVDLAHSHDMSHVHQGITDNASELAQVANQPFVGYHTPQHTHAFTTGQALDQPDGNVRTNTGPALGTVSLLPPYVGLLKIVRIK